MGQVTCPTCDGSRRRPGGLYSVACEACGGSGTVDSAELLARLVQDLGTSEAEAIARCRHLLARTRSSMPALDLWLTGEVAIEQLALTMMASAYLLGRADAKGTR